jgi:hypothetical protein
VQVSIELEGAPPDKAARVRLEAECRKAFRVVPGYRISELELTLAIQRVNGVPGIEKADYRFEFPQNALSEQAVRIVVQAKVGSDGRAEAQKSGIVKTWDLREFPIVYRDSQTLVKLNTTAVGNFAGLKNSWLGNGPTLGAGFPLAENLAPTSAVADIEGSLSVGMAVARRVVGGDSPTYAYVNTNYMSVATGGQDNYASRPRFSTSLEQLFGGLVGGGSTKAGSRWVYHASYGRQTPCIGTERVNEFETGGVRV